MNLPVARQPLPRHLSLDREGPSPCELRGHCGPFLNEEFYNAFPEPLWHGMGDCAECGTTRSVAHAFAWDAEAERSAA